MVPWQKNRQLFISIFHLQNLRIRPFSFKFMLIAWLLLLIATCSIAAGNSPTLSLQDAENLALWKKFKIQPSQVNFNEATSEADTSDSHTQVVFDSIDLSPNTVVPNQGDMTVVTVGVRKAFSNDTSQEIKFQQAQKQAKQKNTEHEKLLLLRNVRHDWLELYYNYQALQLIESHIDSITRLADAIITADKNSGHHVHETLKAKLALFLINNQKTTTQKKIGDAKIKLSRWINKADSNRPLPNQLPTWTAPPPLSDLQQQLPRHPLLQADAAWIKALQSEIAWTKELNKPTFEVGANYGIRQQDAINVDPKLNMISGEFSLNLPSHSRNTEFRDTLAASNQLNTARQQLQADTQMLQKGLIANYQTFRDLNQNLVPAPFLKQNAALSNHSTNNHPPMSKVLSLLQQQQAQLDNQLKQLRQQVDLAQARIELLYFEKR